MKNAHLSQGQDNKELKKTTPPKSSGKKLLLLGSKGLVGTNIVKVLEKDYPDIEITGLKCTEGLVGLTSNFDFVIFGAGYGQPQMFSKHKIETIQINTDHVMCAFSKLKINGKFLYISTSEIYSGAPSPHKETDIGTTTPQHPRACYIEGKRCGEAICMAYKEQGYDVKIARLALAYGPGTKKHDTRVINEFIEQALTTGEIKMKDTGAQYRTYLYVEDAAQMMLDVLFKGKDVVYNIGGISSLRICDLAKLVADLSGSDWEMGNEPIIGAPESVFLDITKINNEFPRKYVSIEEGLKRTIEFQKELYGVK